MHLRRRRVIAATRRALVAVAIVSLSGCVTAIAEPPRPAAASNAGAPTAAPGTVRAPDASPRSMGTQAPQPTRAPEPTKAPELTSAPDEHPSPSPTARVPDEDPVVDPAGPASDTLRLRGRRIIGGAITPKSVVASQHGVFFAQNMMYRHTITVYDRQRALLATISDRIRLSDFGFTRYSGSYRGAPVEAAFTPDGQTAFVSQYAMYGPGFSHPGYDACRAGNHIDHSFVYRIDVASLRKVDVIKVGSTPKFLAVTPDARLLLVSNWCSFDLSVIDIATGRALRRIPLGPNPRGIAVDPDSNVAYVAVWGANDIAKVDLDTFSVRWIRDVGSEPRHLVMDPAGRYLYVTLAGANRVAKIDLKTDAIIDSVWTGRDPRSMAIAADGRSLYVVNYDSATASKVRASTMQVIQTVGTGYHPVGITYDAATRQVWIACYSGSLRVYHDS